MRGKKKRKYDSNDSSFDFSVLMDNRTQKKEVE